MPAAVATNGSSEGRQVKRQRTTQDDEAVVKSQRQVGSSRLFAPYRVTSSFALSSRFSAR
jgi:U3 small nucleolar RNA-associated protein 21